MMRRFVLVAAACALLAAPAAYAAKGGGKGAAGGGGATLVSSCNPCTVGDAVHFSGSGYDPASPWVVVEIAGASTMSSADAAGTVSFDWPWFDSPGSYEVRTYQYQGRHLVLRTSVTVVVE